MAKARILTDPKIMLGKPVIAGTRITVEHVLEELGAGRSIDELLDAHPKLTPQGIRAALAYAARVLKNDIEVPSARSRS